MSGAPKEMLPEGWRWWTNPSPDQNEWYPVHTWSDYMAQNAGEAWWMEANGKMGPHEDSSKVNLSPSSSLQGVRADLEAAIRHGKEQGRNAVELFDECKSLQARLHSSHSAMRACIEAHYVGDGRVVCTNSLKPHLDKFSELLKGSS